MQAKEKEIPEPTLYLASTDSNGIETFVADVNLMATDKPNLVVVTHGWYEKVPWPEDLALAIKSKADSRKWLCGWFDWRTEAKVINPTEAARYGRDIAGPLLGEKIAGLSRNFRHIHLIGHSAGAWVVSEAAKIIASKTNATIHLTLLDAYVPPFWHEEELADFRSEPNAVYWADHYFTRDLTFGPTEKNLTGAYNVDITKIVPGINDHEFPRYWYHATITGEYAKGQRYEGKELFNCLDGLKYGFPRSLEAGGENWKISTKLVGGNKAVTIEKPQKSVKVRLKELFEKILK